jgi:hypothetical protein
MSVEDSVQQISMDVAEGMGALYTVVQCTAHLGKPTKCYYSSTNGWIISKFLS